MANHRGGTGNFAEDRERASEAGRKGGQHSGETLKTILSALPKLVKRGKTVTAAAIASAVLIVCR